MEYCADGQAPDRQTVLQRLERAGHGEAIEKLTRQVRFARVWTATEEAALEDAREGFRQVLSLAKRSRELKLQKVELERDIAEATENSDGEILPRLMRSLQLVQDEFNRLEQQEAIIDGFGILSGRVRGAAGK